jgi:hypothetical protein
MNRKLFTLGYTLFQKESGIDIEAMFHVLQVLNVTHLVDVRSVPYSRNYPQCNADNLKGAGSFYSIPYLHVPELGAKADPSQDVFSRASEIFFEDIFPISKSNRPENTALLADERIVDFQKFRNSDLFSDGIGRIKTAYEKNYTLAIMCSEKSPVDCHRYFFVSKRIEQTLGDWVQVEHVVAPLGDVPYTISNEEVTRQLTHIVLSREEIRKLDIQNPSLLEPAKIDNYFGDTLQEKLADFCDRYWNLMHGWKLEHIH